MNMNYNNNSVNVAIATAAYDVVATAMVGGGGWWRQWVVAAVSEGGMETKKHIFVGVSLGAKSQEIAADIGFDVVS